MEAHDIPPRGNRFTRSRVLSTKVREDHRAVITEKARISGHTVSAFLLQAALDAQVRPAIVVPAIVAEQWGTLGKLAGNLNQIARAANSGDAIDPSLVSMLREVSGCLAEVRGRLAGVGLDGRTSD